MLCALHSVRRPQEKWSRFHPQRHSDTMPERLRLGALTSGPQPMLCRTSPALYPAEAHPGSLRRGRRPFAARNGFAVLRFAAALRVRAAL